MWLVIGISGVTCGGKTTIANNLTKFLSNTICVNQDKYFLPENSEHHVYIPELEHNNWEILTSVDMKKMMEDIYEILRNNSTPTESISILIIEGHTIFNYPPIAEMCQLKFYIDLTKAQCESRRSVRTYDPPDVPGYFEQIVWPEHVKHMEEMKRNVKDIRVLDGTFDKDKLFDIVKSEILVRIEALH